MLRVSPSTLLIGALSAFAFLQEAAGVSQSAHRFLASSFLSSEPEPSCKRWDMAFGELANLAALCENKKIVFVKNGEEKEGRHLPDKEEVLQDLAKKIANHHQKDRPWTKLGPDSTRPFFYASSIVSILELAGEEGGLGGDAETAWIKKALTESRGGLSIFDRDKWNALRHACGYGDVRPSLKPPSGFIALRAERALRGHGHTQLPPSLSLFESSETDFTDGDSSSFLQESGVEKDIKEAIAAGEAITEATKPSPPSSPSSASGKLQLLPFVEKGCVYNNVRYSGPGACPADVITSCMSTSPFVGSHCAGGFVCMEIEAQDKQEREATATAEASGKKPPSSSPVSRSDL
uniref:Uncharacterized protein n=1 Tax=Chromera velia CCMP2878 TaxID=1169474 RepID=A0A0G4HRN4_9ALVE|eukprot:Cvel_8109.t1-p1 / transcript=Cvel_8109.t1 / gene=Cvel_8109 / organism=Chromera_velia_CCMP2878 / gene_product=hypothetical protein / transcript_product=hypothetical protein / location=Cvel_scaffold441:19347-20390(-) / protein_length=348 / sequence_SO=supercontig / SO=protein_coding / is_pseudo=false